MKNSWCFLVITIVLSLDITASSKFGTRYFKYGKLWLRRENINRNNDENWIQQPLDHFNPNDNRSWAQRYYVNDQMTNDKRDVAFLQIGGESPAEYLERGAMFYYAKKAQPILFELEHRYYGKSQPRENKSTENLKYLSSRQALEDIAVFIEAMNKQHNLATNVKWIVFGGSYAGSLAAWARQNYPHLVHGAVSSSGPLLAKLDFSEYFKVVADALRTVSEECVTTVQEGFKQLEELLNDAENRHQIDDLFNLCDKIEENIDSPMDISNLFLNMAFLFAGVVQYDHTTSGRIARFESTASVCEGIHNYQGTELQKLAHAVKSFYGGGRDCIEYSYKQTIDLLRREDWVNGLEIRQWYYQTCTEFGFYQTSSYEPHVFGTHFNIDFFIQQCQDIFGPAFNKTFLEKAVAETNDFYHGLDINVTNTVFVHGSLDPWHVLGVTESHSEDAPVIMLEGASHCTDTSYPFEDDPIALQQAHAQINDLITKWLNN